MKKKRISTNAQRVESRLASQRFSPLVKAYNERIRQSGPEELRGVLQQLQRNELRGVTLEMMRRALENYANNAWVKAREQRCRKPIRSFFTYENLMEWQTPIKANPRAKDRCVRDSALDALDRAYDEEMRTAHQVKAGRVSGEDQQRLADGLLGEEFEADQLAFCFDEAPDAHSTHRDQSVHSIVITGTTAS